jgi:hypothetical protein
VAFQISVYRRSDLFWVRSPPRGLLDDPDHLEEEGLKRLLYDAPLGSGDVVYTHWSSRAASLELPLLASLYDKGLEIHGARLEALSLELNALARAWQSDGIEAELYEDLCERMQYVQEAVQIAREADGFVDIR